ncbi:MAG: TonB-dependent receptor, plug [Brevundimonas sp.]|nr:TonB-dependent receptor, plug [Brevundimonas sp.]
MVEVTSVSRRPESLAQAAAAVFVISREDIRRSGVTSLPEALRLAPNLNIQRVNSVDYAITARGFNGFETANKLLVLIDGRSIYSTLSSGVFWDSHQIMIEDIERIEVISGPGGALYGSNAMNGVINIITRSATETAGLLASASAGTDEQVLSVRQGGALGDKGAWRAYVTAFRRDDSLRPTGEQATDEAEGAHAGGRIDWVSGGDAYVLQADLFNNTVAINEDYSGVSTDIRGGNVLGRWTHPWAGGDLEVQAYYDRFERREIGTREQTDTYDLLAQNASTWSIHRLVFGVGYRSVRSAFKAEPGQAFLDPAVRTVDLTNLFVQDQIALGRGLTLTLGLKGEANSFSGNEVLPSVRLAWEPAQGGLVWGAVSRASRTPNRIERDLTLPGFLVGADFQSENVTAYELGYRANPTPKLSFSISAFYNEYEDLRTVSLDAATILPLRLTNFGDGHTAGVDAWARYDFTATWRVTAGVSTLHKTLGAPSTALDISGLASAGDDPAYQLTLRSQSRLRDDLDLDVRLRAVDDLTVVDHYVEADVRLGWQVRDGLELALIGENLINDAHIETGDALRARAFGRSLRAALRMGF